MSERYISPKQKAVRRFWASGLVGGGVFLGTYLTGQHYINQHEGEPATSQLGTPSISEQLVAGFGDAEVVEIVLAAAALGITGRLALERGALPRTQYAYEQIASRLKPPKPTDVPTLSKDSYIYDGNDSELVRDNNRRMLAGKISRLGDEVIFSGRGDIMEVAPQIVSGTSPDCSYEDASRIAAELEGKINDQPEL